MQEAERIYAQCYLGAWGIVEALKHGADIVLCGRIVDASPTIVCAAYHFGWGREDYEQLAHAFVAGHFIECSTYVTGGNFSGFKSLPGESLNLGFPTVQIEANGEFDVTMQKGYDGMGSNSSAGVCSPKIDTFVTYHENGEVRLTRSERGCPSAKEIGKLEYHESGQVRGSGS